VQRQKVAVAGDDHIRLAIDRKFEEFVVLRVATGRDAFDDVDQRRRGEEIENRNSGNRRDMAGQPGPGNDFAQFS
jgi:hypothetical protein